MPAPASPSDPPDDTASPEPAAPPNGRPESNASGASPLADSASGVSYRSGEPDDGADADPEDTDPADADPSDHPLVVREDPGDRMARLQADADQAERFASQSRAENTKRAYRADWRLFRDWCDERGLDALPATAKTVALYAASVADLYKLTSIERKLSAISQAHKTAGHDSPALTSQEPLHSVWAGIVRSKTRAKDKVAPALTEDVRLMVDHLPRHDEPPHRLTLRSLRDRAILLVGFAGALRRSEIGQLRADDVSFTVDGLRMVIRTSKSDQEGRGHVKGLHYGEERPTCPVRSLQDWMRTAGIDAGPIFRGIDRHGNIADSALTGRSVARIIKKAAQGAGLNPDQYSGHSLRAGFTTQAARAGTPERIIMRHTGHKSEKMVREYIREGRLFDENPTEGLGL